ncbi:MAG: LAGLIDADG family homing endonuclease, partial [Pseudomonadota bacterium]
GYGLCLTADHPVQRLVAATRYRRCFEWVPAARLRPGDQVLLNEHGAALSWGGAHGFEEGYLIGLLIGDGTLKEDKAVLSAWPGQAVANAPAERPGVLGLMAEAERAARTLPNRSDFAGWMAVPGRGEHRLVIASMRRLALSLGLRPGAKTITPAIERNSSDFHRGVLKGLFDSDGSVQGTQAKGVSIRLAQSDAALLAAAQRMLLRLGIPSTIYRDRRREGSTLLPDGRGGRRDYPTAAQHELVISGEAVRIFAQRIGFADTDKAGRLAALLAAYKRAPNRLKALATVRAIEPAGEEEVFDVQIPGANAFDANGFVVHNCGEQPLPPYGACLLGSINLAKLVARPFEADAALDLEELERIVPLAVRMMDNVTDVSRFPLEAQLAEALAKRRIGLGVTGLADALIL